MPLLLPLFWFLLIALAGWCFLNPETASWIVIGILVVALDLVVLWLALGIGYPNPRVNEAPHFFTDTEAELIRRHKVYFSFPGASKMFSSMLAAVGLVSWVLVPWLLYKAQWIQAGILLANMGAAGPLSHKLSPLNGLRMLAKKGNAEAEELLEAHDPAWDKILEARKIRREKAS